MSGIFIFLEANKLTMKYLKIITIALIAIILLLLRNACNSNKVELTPAEIAKSKADSINLEREKEINYALTTLKDLTLKNLKDPNSFELIDRTWDKSDSLKDKVKLLIVYRAKNSFGGMQENMVKGIYDRKTKNVMIDEFVQR